MEVASLSDWTIAILLLLGVVLAFPLAVGISAALGWVISRLEKPLLCLRCGNRSVVELGMARANPPPNLSFHRCEECGAEYVKVLDGKEELTEREASP